ncbi:MAG: hypothetical protein ACHQ01_07840, partial [Candidatus Limnocylindrales bacterium]
ETAGAAMPAAAVPIETAGAAMPAAAVPIETAGAAMPAAAVPIETAPGLIEDLPTVPFPAPFADPILPPEALPADSEQLAPGDVGPATSGPIDPAALPSSPSPTPSGASAAASTPEPTPASEKPARKESTAELVSFGLIAAGTVIGMASLFLPWANSSGIGIGNYATSTPPPNQWGWGMPASIPLLLLSGLVLGAIAGKDRAQEQLPNLASVISRVTDMVLPMILGGLYLGVFLLYLTIPSGYGSGVLLLFLGAGLMIAGAAVSLFSSPEVP